ncbi:MAG: DnaJ domain-containing protein, partial [Candidatus Omnitrophica bacterium]|nr:DnaJ domain-containing protein [Candidatus Omnitrophota bacterium]
MEDRDKILNSKTPYQALFLPSTATPEEAKHQYFKLVRKFSPEKEEQCFRIIRRAYEELKDPAKKAAADVMLFTGGRGRVRFSGVTSETVSEVKITREIEEMRNRDLSDEANKKNLITA